MPIRAMPIKPIPELVERGFQLMIDEQQNPAGYMLESQMVEGDVDLAVECETGRSAPKTIDAPCRVTLGYIGWDVYIIFPSVRAFLEAFHDDRIA